MGDNSIPDLLEWMFHRGVAIERGVIAGSVPYPCRRRLAARQAGRSAVEEQQFVGPSGAAPTLPIEPWICPHCHHGQLIFIRTLPRNTPRQAMAP